MQKHIVAAVSEQGNVELELYGFVGAGCVDAEQKLRDSLATFGICVRIDALREKNLEECEQEACSKFLEAERSNLQIQSEII